jgi:RNA polymerase sigma-70 factor, ECF subfamily
MNQKSRLNPPNYKILNQSQLTDLAQQGDHKAFEILIKPLSPKIYARALKALGHEVEADDILQDTLLKAYSKLYTFRKEARFSSWIYQICTHQILARYRQRTQQQHHKRYNYKVFNVNDKYDLNQNNSSQLPYYTSTMKDYHIISDHCLNHNQPEVSYLNKEYIQHIKEAIEHLDSPYRSILQLWLQGLDLSQIQAHTHLSRSAVKSRIARARQSLKVNLQRVGFE